MNRLLRIGAAAPALAVSSNTLRRCEASGKTTPARLYRNTMFDEDLASNISEIIAVFSVGLYRSRSRKNQKLLDGVRQAVKDGQC